MERDDFSLTTLMGFLNGAKTHLQKSIEYTNRLIAEFSDVFNKEDLKRNLQNMVVIVPQNRTFHNTPRT